MTSELDRLVDIAAIERVMFDYATAIDHRDYPLLRSCLTAELTVAMRPGGEVGFVGLGTDPVMMTADAFIERNQILFLGFAGTHHQVTNLRIDVVGDRATLSAHLQAVHFLPGEPGTEYAFGGFYANELIRMSGGWRLSTIDITVLWERGDAAMTARARQTGLARWADRVAP